MFNVYISIVSHGNDDDIISNIDLSSINKLNNVFVLIRDNLNSDILKLFCIRNNYVYSFSEQPLGFGENNNENFDLALKLGMSKNDVFILMNPDVLITCDMIIKLCNSIDCNRDFIYAVNLYKDNSFNVTEHSLRYFPSLINFLFFLKSKSFTKAYDKNKLNDKDFVDWAAGSFLVFKSDLYMNLQGFDTKYFMYFEDTDICYRAKSVFNVDVTYLKYIKAYHKGGYKNRILFSIHFKWYLSSLLRFLFKYTFINFIKFFKINI